MGIKSTDDLIKSRIIQRGEKAKGNPGGLGDPSVLGIANKDYPAMTPLLWNSVYEALGITTRNSRFFGDPVNMEQIFETLKSDTRYIGGDVGVGFKDKVWRIIDELDPIARAMQSINVISRTNEGKLKGYNTDGLGYVESLERVLRKKGGRTLKDKKVVLLGAGGTCNSIAFYLAERGAKITILNRTASKGEALASRVNGYFRKELAFSGGRELIACEVSDAIAVVSLIDDPDSPLYKYSAIGGINLPPTDKNIERNINEAREIMKTMPKGAIISDVMLREGDTATIKEAKLLGFETLDGKPMVLNQAIEAFCLVNERALKETGVTKQKIEEIMSRALD